MRSSSFILSTGAILAALTSSVVDAAEPILPSIVSHRGLLLDAPENTLANFSACLDLHIGFEFDVRRSRDAVLVCLHDETLDRTTDGKGRCSDYTSAELQRFDAGSWFSESYRGEKIPTIDSVFKLISVRQAAGVYAVDLKADDAELEGDVVRLAQRHGVLDRLLFIGRTIDHADVRQRLRTANRNAHTAALAGDPSELARAIAEADADWVYLRFVPSTAEIGAIRAAGKKSFLAGKAVAGRLPDAWSEARNAGVDAILTDYALECRRGFARRP